MNLLLLWLAFTLCTLTILYCGVQLSRYGDIIAEKTGFGGLWIGVILLAFVTSLPELVTGLSSVIIFQTPDIAAGDVFGSCVFNIFILALLDILWCAHRCVSSSWLDWYVYTTRIFLLYNCCPHDLLS
jgi:cation:H+ antiporter